MPAWDDRGCIEPHDSGARDRSGLHAVLRGPARLSAFREEQFCEFEVEGQRFIVWEPFGDNSRYWVGPEPAVWCKEVDVVRAAFRRARPWKVLCSTFLRRQVRT